MICSAHNDVLSFIFQIPNIKAVTIDTSEKKSRKRQKVFLFVCMRSNVPAVVSIRVDD